MPSKRELAGLALLIAIHVAVLVRATGYAYVWDDVQEIQTNRHFDEPLAAGIVLTQTARTNPELLQLQEVTIAYDSYRPLLFATYWVEVQLFGREPGPMHATNLVLGVLAILVAFAVARRWLAAVAPEADPRWALLVTAVFAIHPLQVEPVAYISGRGDLLAGLLALSAMYAALRAGDRRVWIVAAAIAFAGSLLAKESCIGLPAALAVVALASGTLRRQWWIHATLAGVAIAYLVLRAALVSATSSGTVTDGLVGMPGVWVEYLRIALLPFDLSTERLHGSHYTTVGWITLALVVVLVVAARRPGTPLALRAALGALGWYAMMLGPSALSIQSTGVAADRYGYAALFGFAVALVMVVAHVTAVRPRLQKPLAGALGLWGVLLVVVAWRQVPTWRDNVALYSHAVAMAPASSEAHFRLGFLAARAGNWELGLPLLERAVELDGGNVRALNNLGVGYLETGQLERAEATLQRAVESNPAHFRSWLNLGLARIVQGKREGCRDIARALEINPSYGTAQAEYARRCSR